MQAQAQGLGAVNPNPRPPTIPWTVGVPYWINLPGNVFDPTKPYNVRIVIYPGAQLAEGGVTATGPGIKIHPNGMSFSVDPSQFQNGVESSVSVDVFPSQADAMQGNDGIEMWEATVYAAPPPAEPPLQWAGGGFQLFGLAAPAHHAHPGAAAGIGPGHSAPIPWLAAFLNLATPPPTGSLILDTTGTATWQFPQGSTTPVPIYNPDGMPFTSVLSDTPSVVSVALATDGSGWWATPVGAGMAQLSGLYNISGQQVGVSGNVTASVASQVKQESWELESGHDYTLELSGGVPGTWPSTLTDADAQAYIDTFVGPQGHQGGARLTVLSQTPSDTSWTISFAFQATQPKTTFTWSVDDAWTVTMTDDGVPTVPLPVDTSGAATDITPSPGAGNYQIKPSTGFGAANVVVVSGGVTPIPVNPGDSFTYDGNGAVIHFDVIDGGGNVLSSPYLTLDAGSPGADGNCASGSTWDPNQGACTQATPTNQYTITGNEGPGQIQLATCSCDFLVYPPASGGWSGSPSVIDGTGTGYLNVLLQADGSLAVTLIGGPATGTFYWADSTGINHQVSIHWS